METDCFGGDDVFERTALDAGEHLRINFLGESLAAKDQSAARAAQGLMGGGGDKISMFHRTGMDPGGNEAGDVRDVRQQVCADFASDLAHALEINGARIGAGTDSDHLRLVFTRHLGELVVIDALVVFADAVMDDLKEFTGEIGLVAVRQMAPVRKVHGQHFVSRFEDGEIAGHVGLAAGVGLDVDVIGAEDPARAVNGKLLDDIHIFATTVPAFTRVTLGIFVGEHRTLRLQNGGADKIFAGDQLDIILLALFFVLNGISDGGIDIAQAQLQGGEAKIDLVHTTLVATAFKFCVEESIEDLFREFAVGIAGQAEDVDVVVAAHEFGFLFIEGLDGAHAGESCWR